MSVTSNTRPFFSSKFYVRVRAYRGYVIVPVDTVGSRGGSRRRTFEIWTGDQQTRYISKIATLGEAKALIDSGLSLEHPARDGEQ